MATVIGTVKSLDGKFFSKDENGNITELHTGDVITKGMIVFGDENNLASASIEIAMEDGSDNILLSGTDEQLFDGSLLDDLNLEEGLASETLDDLLDEGSFDETASGDEELLAEDAGETQFMNRDGAQVDVNSGLNLNETASGTEELRASERGSGEFSDRTGAQTDINSGLRDAPFTSNNVATTQQPTASTIIPTEAPTPAPTDAPTPAPKPTVEAITSDTQTEGTTDNNLVHEVTMSGTSDSAETYSFNLTDNQV